MTNPATLTKMTPKTVSLVSVAPQSCISFNARSLELEKTICSIWEKTLSTIQSQVPCAQDIRVQLSHLTASYKLEDGTFHVIDLKTPGHEEILNLIDDAKKELSETCNVSWDSSKENSAIRPTSGRRPFVLPSSKDEQLRAISAEDFAKTANLDPTEAAKATEVFTKIEQLKTDNKGQISKLEQEAPSSKKRDKERLEELELRKKIQRQLENNKELNMFAIYAAVIFQNAPEKIEPLLKAHLKTEKSEIKRYAQEINNLRLERVAYLEKVLPSEEEFEQDCLEGIIVRTLLNHQNLSTDLFKRPEISSI